MRKLFILFCVVVTIGVIAGNKFCDLSCWDNETSTMVANVGCETNPESNFNTYGRSVKIEPMTDSLKDIILSFFNNIRNYIAGGKNSKYLMACRMATMQWDDDLAHLAEIHVKKYDMVRDKCFRTNDFDFPDQTLYNKYKKPVGNINHAVAIKKGISSWYRKQNNFKSSEVKSFSGPTTEAYTHNYAVMMIDKNSRVGCSYGTNQTHVILVCNYATTYMKNKPIYDICNSPGEHCASGRSVQYNNLCNDAEEYDVNNWD